jgi:methylated-DNA-protein-cysteine methyltransferase related protein
MDASTNKIAIYTALRSVPVGKVVTYGQLAKMAGLPGAARLAGTVLCQLPENTDLPWHRVVNAQGKISMNENSPGYSEQIRRLQAEGVLLANGRIPLKIYQW